MKAVLAVLGGCALSLGMFAGGAATAAWFIAVEPGPAPQLGEEQARAWTLKPRRVDPANQDFVRVAGPSVVASAAAAGAPGVSETGGQGGVEPAATGIDGITTAAVPAPIEAQEPEMNAVHVEWCAERYRSYRPRDNSYTPYSGGRRECVSPFAAWAEEPLDGAAEPVSPAPAEGDGFAEVSYVAGEEAIYVSADAGMSVDAEHVDYCFSRYRSYRPEDNTYQPYGGGPRQECR